MSQAQQPEVGQLPSQADGQISEQIPGQTPGLVQGSAASGGLDQQEDPARPRTRAQARVQAQAVAQNNPWKRVARGLRPRLTASQLLAGLLCAMLGFALVMQMQARPEDNLSALRQDDLVRMLDDVSSRADQLAQEVIRLEATRNDLTADGHAAAAALELAQARAVTEGILSGRLPASGPGIDLRIEDPQGDVRASDMFNVLEELRNAGAEVVSVNDVRLVTSSFFVDTPAGIVSGNSLLSPPFHFVAIGDPGTMDRALEIPGGALPSIRQAGDQVTAQVDQHDQVTVTATVDLTAPQYARASED